MRRNEGGWSPMGGPIAEGAACGDGETQKPGHASHGEDVDTSSPLGELHSYLWELIGYRRKQSSCETAGTNGSRRALYGVLRVNVLIHRGLREKAELEPLTPMHAASCVCPAHIGVCPVLPDAFSSTLRSGRNRAIPKREEGTGADHGPSSPVPPRARNALRLRFAPGR